MNFTKKQQRQHEQYESKCLICKRKAVTSYPPTGNDWSSTPSCGRVACEMQMQAAEDYHNEHANGS